MKKILALLVLVLGFTGCSYKGERLDVHDSRNVPVVREFNYNGHHYIEFGSVVRKHLVGTYIFEGGVVHDPDCPCHKSGN